MDVGPHLIHSRLTEPPVPSSGAVTLAFVSTASSMSISCLVSGSVCRASVAVRPMPVHEEVSLAARLALFLPLVRYSGGSIVRETQALDCCY